MARVTPESSCFEQKIVRPPGPSLLCKMSDEMTAGTSKSNPKQQRDLVEQTRVHNWTWRTGGAVCGLGCGIIAPLVGSILTAIAWFTGPEWHGFFLQRDGTVLLFLTIPFLIFGAHCLDLMDKHDEDANKPRLKLD